MSQSPPKPWERNGAIATPTAISSSFSLAPAPPPLPLVQTMSASPAVPPAPPLAPTVTTTATAPVSASGAPALPARPSSLTTANANRYGTAANTTTGAYGAYNRPPGYGLGTGYGGIGSPYSRFGGYGGSMYGGGMGMGMGMGGLGGYSGFGGGYPGASGDPNDPNSLTQGMQNSTAATFQMIESIVGAFGGFAQMLESTYMATHSSFFAMVQVAEQFGTLKNTLGSILGIFTMMRWARLALAKLTGRPLPASAGELTASNFAAFEGLGKGKGGHAGAPKPSKKPFFFFIVAVFGLPYLMGKLIRTLASRQEQEERRRIEAAGGLDAFAAGGAAGGAAGMDPSKLEFCRATFDFTPEVQGGIELEVKKGDLVAVLSKCDPMGNPSQWWKCRARDSRVGYLPSPYLEVISRKDGAAGAGAGVGAGAGAGSGGSMKQITDGATVVGSRTSTMTSEMASELMKDTKPGDISIESFQKSQFFS